MTCPSKRRDIVFDGLAECPENEWLEFAEAYRFVHATGHRFAVTENPSFLYIADAHYGSIYDSVAVDRQYLRALLLESLATLGMVDVAYVYPHYLARVRRLLGRKTASTIAAVTTACCTCG